ncbi:MAG: arginase [Gammaproteobacteria bacterium]
MSLSILSVASGIAAGNSGCGKGPAVLKNSSYWPKQLSTSWCPTIVPPEDKKTVLEKVQAMVIQLAHETSDLVKKQERFLVVGGDHSAAIGTWSGVKHALKDDFGLLWFDAHLDSHTHNTSESGNIHGMPVAALLGQGVPELTHIMDNQPAILPQNLCIIGVHSFEAGEQKLIEDLNVRVYYMDEVNERGLSTCVEEALKRIQQHTKVFGISFDVDSIDPLEAPGVGTPEQGGLHFKEFLPIIHQVSKKPKCIGF